MTFFYMDTDAGSDANAGTTWALAKLTLEGLLAVMVAGDIGVIQGAAVDTSAVNRTLTSPGTVLNPCKIIGVVDGTTNEGSAIAPSDLAVIFPIIEASGTTTITLVGATNYLNIEIKTTGGDIRCTTASSISFTTGRITMGLELDINIEALIRFDSIIFNATTTNDRIRGAGGSAEFYKCSWELTAINHILRTDSSGYFEFISCDLSTIPSGGLILSGNVLCKVKVINCKMPSTAYSLGTAFPNNEGYVEIIQSNSVSSVAIGDSIQDYAYEDAFGSIDADFVAIRTGGADDGASGAFAYAMTPKADATLEGSNATLRSLWMSVWLAGGANTLTVYIANDGAVDYLEDEAWVEFYTPDAGDTAQHDQAFDPADERLLDSTTTITDDAVSVWGGTAANGQKFSATVTTGFEGFAYARLHVAKRQATPDTVFLDPVIVVT